MKRGIQNILGVAALFVSSQASAQMVGNHAYIIGDYIEIAIDSAGFEGTDTLAGTHYRTGATGGSPGIPLFGFVANPAMDSWGEYNGDFFVPGSPENGWGIQIDTLTYSSNGNNGFTTGGVDDTPILGEITDYYETTDSIIVTWEGVVPGMDVIVKYILEKDQLYYTTDITLSNTSTAAIADVYYYRNLDPDHNMQLGWGFQTQNTIESQGDGPSGIAKVSATQTDTWVAEFSFEAYGANWKACYGGFLNRNGKALWDGFDPDLWSDPFVIEVDSTNYADQAISLAYNVGTVPTGKAAPVNFSFISRFGGPEAGLGMDEDEIEQFKLYPNPSTENITIEVEGNFDYLISDVQGKIHVFSSGADVEVVDVSGLAAGTYFVKVNSKGKFTSQTLIIQ